MERSIEDKLKEMWDFFMELPAAFLLKNLHSPTPITSSIRGSSGQSYIKRGSKLIKLSKTVSAS